MKEKARVFIQEKPFVCMAISACVGLLLGAVLSSF